MKSNIRRDKSILIQQMDQPDIALIWASPELTGSKRPKDLYANYYTEQKNGQRVVLLAFYYDIFAGHITILWNSEYPLFAELKIPEIKDLLVHSRFRRRGIGTALLDEAEKLIFERSSAAGIAVGLYSDYGSAQRLYARRGYIPDGRGLMYKEQTVIPGKLVMVDDDLLIFMTKDRP